MVFEIEDCDEDQSYTNQAPVWMKVQRANKRWVSTPPSLTSETLQFLASAETCFTYLGAVGSYIISIREDWHLHQNLPVVPSRFDQFIILFFLARKINLVDMLHGCQSIVDLMVVFIGHGLTVFSICSPDLEYPCACILQPALFWISSESLMVLAITEAKIATKLRVIITELTAAIVIQPFRFKLLSDSIKCRKNLPNHRIRTLLPLHHALHDHFQSRWHGDVKYYNLAIVGRHQCCPLQINLLQKIHDFHELSGPSSPLAHPQSRLSDCWRSHEQSQSVVAPHRTIHLGMSGLVFST